MELQLRPAQNKDLMNLFNLANDLVVRRNSFQSGSINLSDHRSWFKAKLEDHNSLILIGENQKNFVGVVRFTFQTENLISISIAKDFRGQKIGPQLINKAIDYLNKTKPLIKKITAYIKVDNIASVKTFEKAGFKFDQELTVKKNRALRYIYLSK